MCIICIEISKNKLRSHEAFRNLSEIYLEIDRDHRDEVIKEVLDLKRREQEKDENDS